MSIGADLNDARFGQRIVKVNFPAQIEGDYGLYKGRYYGEWSQKTNKPHGRGVFLRNDGSIFIRYFFDGKTRTDGKLVYLDNEQLAVG